MEKQKLLERLFGYREFRPGQEELIDAITAGRDVFGVMPTGGGKSMCYQLPALLMGGVTIVISPLISLMRDQVMALKAAGVSAAYINSSLSGPQMQAVYRNLLAGQYKIVYVAPERLDYTGFSQIAAQLPISLIAVDEAHCISQWGQDFRPSYLRIVEFIEGLPQRPPVGAFTATATKQVQEDIVRRLGLRDPLKVVTGFDRPNLYFEVQHPESKDKALLELLAQRPRKSGIVYCATRKAVEQVCEDLCAAGYEATRYHAGLEESERNENQEDFLYDRKNIMVATNAFGMGIDKSNVSFVIHYNMPKSLEAYYQEAGRAGRDGAPADCVLLFSQKDVGTAWYLINNSSENEELDEDQREMVRQQDLARLEAMVGYCKVRVCLRGYLLDYFGQSHPETCGNCGSCREEYVLKDITREAQMILSCVKRIYDRLGYWVGSAIVARVLQGSKEKRVTELGLDGLSTYGLMKNVGRTTIRQMMEQLEQAGYLSTEMEHQTVRLTAKAGEVLYHGQPVQMRVPREPEPEELALKTGKLTGEAAELFEALRELRGELARKAGVPAYVIFSNATLMDMARKKPKNMSEFRRVSGVGELKANWYGKEFLKVTRTTSRSRFEGKSISQNTSDRHNLV